MGEGVGTGALGNGVESGEEEGGGRRERSWEMAVGTDMKRGGSKILRPLFIARWRTTVSAAFSEALEEEKDNQPC